MLSCVITVVGRLHAYVVPDWFDSVELRAIRWQQTKVEAVPVRGKPLPHFRCFMIRSIVVNQKHFLTAIARGESVQKLHIA